MTGGDSSKEEYFSNGTFGSVYISRSPNETILIKYLSSRQAEAYEKERNVLESLSHDSIVSYKGIRRNADGRLGIEMEFCERGSLSGVIFRQEWLYSKETVIEWMRDLIRALLVLKTENIVHRDIKPENIFLTADFQVKLGDFGSYRLNTSEGGVIEGTTPRYTSPFLVNDTSSHQDDLYSVGLVLWEIVERRRVFSQYGRSHFKSIEFTTDVRHGRLKGLDAPKCPEQLKTIILGCTKFNPNERFDLNQALAVNQDDDWLHGELGKHAFTPERQEGREKMFRPIGFDGTRDLVAVDESISGNEDLFSFTDPTFDSLADSYEEEEEPGSSSKTKETTFEHKFQDLPLESVAEVNDLFRDRLEKATEEEKKRFLERKSEILSDHLEKFKEFNKLNQVIDKDLTIQSSLEEIFEQQLDEEYKNQCSIYDLSFVFINMAGKLNYALWTGVHHAFGATVIGHSFKTSTHTRRLYLEMLYSKNSKNLWFLMKRETEFALIRRDLDQVRLIPYESLENDRENGYLFYKMHPDDSDFLDSEKCDEFIGCTSEPLDFDVVLGAVGRLLKRIELNLTVETARWVPKSDFQRKLEPFKGLRPLIQQEVPGYVFQLRNRPYLACNHDPKCPFGGYVPKKFSHLIHPHYYELYPDGIIEYPACTKESGVAFLELYYYFCEFFDNLNGALSRELFLSDLEDIQATLDQDFFYFFHAVKGKEDFLLLDHPMNYYKKERISCFRIHRNQLQIKLFTIRAEEVEVFLMRNTLIRMTSFGEIEIIELGDELVDHPSQK